MSQQRDGTALPPMPEGFTDSTAWEALHFRFAGNGACEAMPCFRLATPHGHMDFCRDHIDPMIASLPPEWIEAWAWREPPAVEETGDIPF